MGSRQDAKSAKGGREKQVEPQISQVQNKRRKDQTLDLNLRNLRNLRFQTRALGDDLALLALGVLAA